MPPSYRCLNILLKLIRPPLFFYFFGAGSSNTYHRLLCHSLQGSIFMAAAGSGCTSATRKAQAAGFERENISGKPAVAYNRTNSGGDIILTEFIPHSNNTNDKLLSIDQGVTHHTTNTGHAAIFLPAGGNF